ncbi:MAG TPA: hypothetical protein VGE01_11200 [Fimbriimonas sp.]
MTPTLYAAFDDATQAESAAVQLLERGFRPQDLSLVVNESQRQHREEGDAGGLQDGASSEEGLNPAQNDYPTSDNASVSDLSSAPADAVRMYNTRLETKEFGSGYDADVEREIERDAKKDQRRREADRSIEELPVKPKADEAVAGDALEEAGVQKPVIHDAKSTVAASAGLGLGVGAAAALAAIALPGIGLVIGGGALATAVAGLAASSASGAAADGIVGYLKDQGVPADAIPSLRQAYETGGAILGVALEKAPADSVEVESILRSFGAGQIGAYSDEEA